MQYILFTNYVFKQIIIYGRQFAFTEVKVIKLAVEHYIFCLHLMQYVFFTNYVFKQIIIYGRQFEFTEVKVIKLAVEHYDYDTSCGNNNTRYDDSDHACLLSRVLKMEGANLNSIILWLWFFGG